MSLMEMASALRKRWRVIVVSIIVVVAGGVAYLSIATPQYEATSQLFVGASGATATSSSNAYFSQVSVQQRMSSYVHIAGTESVLAPVVESLSLPYDWQHLGSLVSVTNPANTTLLTITATDPSAITASNLANAVSDQVATSVEKLEKAPHFPSPVKATVVQPATPPAHPASPNPALDLGAALLLGAALGVILALVRDTLDSSVKTVEDLEERFDVVVLAAIPFDRQTGKQPVLPANVRRSARAEALHQLRTNLQYVQIDQQPRSIVVTSAVKEEGKTMIACNLAVMLARIGVDVILVDGDLRRPKVAEFMGIDATVGLTNVLAGWTGWEEAVQDWGDKDVRLRVLAAAQIPPNPAELLAGNRMDRLLSKLEAACDVVIIDGPPLLPVADAALLAASSSGTVLVTRHGKTKRGEVGRALAALEAVDARLYGVVLNMSRRDASEASYYAYHQDDRRVLDAPIPRADYPAPAAVSSNGTRSASRRTRTPSRGGRDDRG